MNSAHRKTMRAMTLAEMAPMCEQNAPLSLVNMPIPVPGEDEVLLKVLTCGVCHTELDEIEGRAPPAFFPIVPGHQVIGTVAEVGANAGRVRQGDRVGVGWIFHSCGGKTENLSEDFRATGKDANGGYAEYMVAPADYVYPIPDVFSDTEAAPLLCAGSIGYRALMLAGVQPGKRLGLTGFGGSGHLVLQLARHLDPESEVYVFARSSSQQDFALELGATWAGDIDDKPPNHLHAIIDTTPAWAPVVHSLGNLAPGGRLVINAIRKDDTDITSLTNLDYARDLWREKELKTVTNITADDIREFLSLAAEVPLRPQTTIFPLEQANDALGVLHKGAFQGSLVLRIT